MSFALIREAARPLRLWGSGAVVRGQRNTGLITWSVKARPCGHSLDHHDLCELGAHFRKRKGAQTASLLACGVRSPPSSRSPR